MDSHFNCKGVSGIYEEVNSAVYKKEWNLVFHSRKHKNEYRYLSDELVGIRPYDKMDVSLKSRLIEEAIETPYGMTP